VLKTLSPSGNTVPLPSPLHPPGFQGVQAANSSWLNSARVKKESLQRHSNTKKNTIKKSSLSALVAHCGGGGRAPAHAPPSPPYAANALIVAVCVLTPPPPPRTPPHSATLHRQQHCVGVCTRVCLTRPLTTPALSPTHLQVICTPATTWS